METLEPGRMGWMGNQLLMCAEMGNVGRNVGHTDKNTEYECMKCD